jgi:hypothetical protein
MLNSPAVKSTIRGSLFRFKKNLRSEIHNSLTISGLPLHKLVLKVNCIVLLIRNLNTKEALVNGTRMRIKFIHRNAIDCELLTGTARNKIILIPRITVTYSSTILPFNFRRTEFPIIPAFAMTIEKNWNFIEATSFYTWSIVGRKHRLRRSFDSLN